MYKDLKECKQRIERRIKKYERLQKRYEDRVNTLSIYGYWSLGYFSGKLNMLDEILDTINDYLNERSTL